MKYLEKDNKYLYIIFNGKDYGYGYKLAKAKKARYNGTNQKWFLPYSDGDERFFLHHGFKFHDPHATLVTDYTPATLDETYRYKQLNKTLTPKELRPFQQDGLRFLLTRDRSILALPPGAGKTIVGTSWINNVKSRNCVLIITPAALKIHWQRELKRWCNIESYIIEGLTPHTLPIGNNVFIINYDILYTWVNPLSKIANIVVCDESHYLGGTDTKRVKAFHKITANTNKLLLLTGTPIKNKIENVYAQLRAVMPDVFNNKTKFMNKFCAPTIEKGNLVYEGASNLDLLHKMLKPIMYHRTKAEILPDLPTKNYMIYAVDYDEAFKKANDELAMLIANGEVDKVQERIAIANLQQTAFHLKESVVYDHIDGLIENDVKKIVVVAYHRLVVKALMEKYKCMYISGNVASNKRQGIVDEFQTNKDNVLVIQIKAGGVGFSIDKSNEMVIVETGPADHSEFLQVTDRIHRLTSKFGQCNYSIFTVADSIDEVQIRRLVDRSKRADKVLTGKGDNFLEEAKEIIK